MYGFNPESELSAEDRARFVKDERRLIKVILSLGCFALCLATVVIL